MKYLDCRLAYSRAQQDAVQVQRRKSSQTRLKLIVDKFDSVVRIEECHSCHNIITRGEKGVE